MAEKTCSHCVHVDVCENRFSWLDQEDNTKHIICHHFKDKADVVEVVRCKDCKHSYFVKSCSKYECRKGCGTLKYANDFCSYGEKKTEQIMPL